MKSLEERVTTLSSLYKIKYQRRVFRLGLSLNRECPNRLSSTGCIFCQPESFTDLNLSDKSIKQQIDFLIPKLKAKCGQVGFIAYFQDNTSTCGPLDELRMAFQQADLHPDILEIVISTRPDFINTEIINIIKYIKKNVTVELGIQSIHDNSLQYLNRNHSQEDNQNAVNLLIKNNIPISAHLILGIPYETEEDIKKTIQWTINNGFSELKLHHLVAYKGTRLGDIYEQEPSLFTLQDPDTYIRLLGELIKDIPGNIAISRFFTSNLNQTGKSLNQFPGIKKIWLNQLTKYLDDNDIYQGMNLRSKHEATD